MECSGRQNAGRLQSCRNVANPKIDVQKFVYLFLNAGPPLFQSSNDVTAASGDEELFPEPLLNAIYELLEILIFCVCVCLFTGIF